MALTARNGKLLDNRQFSRHAAGHLAPSACPSSILHIIRYWQMCIDDTTSLLSPRLFPKELSVEIFKNYNFLSDTHQK